ncbi:LicD family protein [Treponema pedis]|uniref:Lipopolysaccharide biosynthesis protein LicD n=4 Tax=Treponema pedis TaxID=409322 RepID=S5ZJI8_9SPIR|nr:LicD family protein [Treponema pedis]AGT42707.1 lipopolysaccharide biosynthesis protein LicD [Treponema pedis str. T A4]QSI03592.1 LicD family protein [Treponema pedis]
MQELSLKEIQEESLKILKLVDNICREQGFTYCLFYGTLIGAVRHNGFIPWDDDIDIAMPRNDYERLKQYFIVNKDKLMPYVYFDPDTNKDYPYMLARICNLEFKIETQNEYDSGMGVFIDIYPLDIVSNNILKRFLISLQARFFTALYVVKSRKEMLKKRKWFYTVLQYPLYFLSLFYSKGKIYKKQMILIRQSYNNKSNTLSCIVWSGDVFKYFYEKSDIEDVIDWEFEKCFFKIPRNYDKILTNDYDDYMQLPPEKDRIAHHFYKVYRKDIEK